MKLDRRLLELTRGLRPALAMAVGAGLVAGIVTVLQAFYLARVIGEVFLGGHSLDGVRSPLVILVALVAARALLTWVREVSASHAAARIRHDLRLRLLDRLFLLGPAYVRGERTGELSNTLVEGVEALDGYFSQYLPSLALAALVPTAILIFVFPLDLVSALVFLVTAPLIPLFMILIGKMADILTRRQWESLSRMSAHFLDMLQGLATLKLFNRSRIQIETIGRISNRFRETTLGVLRVAFLSALVLELLATVSTALVAVEVGLRLLYSTISFEQAFFVLILAPEFYLPLRNLGAGFHAGMSGVAAAGRIFEVLEGQQATGNRQQATGDGQPDGSGQVPALSSQESPRPRVAASPCLPAPSITFQDVHVSYEGGQRPALRGVSFKVEQGQKVALVGPSGSGKSTVAQLLLRFLEPDQGEILVDGTPLAGLPASWWREQVAWVPQDPYLFNATVAENIRLATPEASPGQVVEAARLAHADQFIEALPDGYNTMIGERGARLSGGQAQRIALARAFLKDAPFLILDEAVSNLDVEHETLVQESLHRLLEGRTALIIAHRLGTAYRADQIVVLSEGQVAEAGPHAELMERKGLYHRLVCAQERGDGETGGRGDGETRGRGETATRGGVGQGFIPCRPGTRADTQVRPYGPQGGHPPLPEGEANPGATGAQPRKPGQAEVFLRLLKLVAPFKGWMALATLLGFATVGSGIGLMATASFLIASAALHPSVADLAVPIVGVRFFGLSRGVFRYLERYVSHRVTFHLLSQFRVWFYQALEPLAPARLMQYRSGDLLNRIVADIETLEQFYLRVLAPPLVACLVALVMWVFLSGFGMSIALTLLAVFLLAGVAVPAVTHRLGSGPSQEANRTRAELKVQLVDAIQGMAELLAFGREGDHRELVRSLSRTWMARQESLSRITGLHSALGVLLANLGMVAVLMAAIPMVSAGGLEGIYLPVLALAALAGFEAVAPLPLAFQYLGGTLDAARRLFEIVDTDPAPMAPATARQPHGGRVSAFSDPEGGQAGMVPRGYVLMVEDLTFRYAPGEPTALRNVGFQLPQGHSIAIVGPSGAGKTTLAHLILRFWDYQEGRVLLGGRDLRDWPQEEVRRAVGVVSQRTHLFNATLRDNLLLGRPDATEEQLMAAVERAQLQPLVQALPRGLHSWIGEQGQRLSGGERQRVAVARALLKDAPILILDEPAANLDAITEGELMRSIYALMEGRTTLVITHHLLGLEEMDEILVLSGGRIVERGRHPQLLRAGGVYGRMWDLQSQMMSLEEGYRQCGVSRIEGKTATTQVS